MLHLLFVLPLRPFEHLVLAGISYTSQLKIAIGITTACDFSLLSSTFES